MKLLNTTLFLSVLVTLSACRTKEIAIDTDVRIPEGRTVLLNVRDDVKSSYQEGLGVNIDGTENIAVLYSVNDTLKGSLKAEPKGQAVYSFTIPEGVQPDEMFYGVMPYSSMVSPVTDSKTLFQARIFPVQYPSSTSFDPHYDYLSAEGFKVEGEEATISKFRRIVAPLRLKIKGLPSGAKVRTAELSLSQGVNEDACIGLVGDARVYATDNFRKSAVVALMNPGNTVSALYPDGLEADNGEWNVWYVVNPSSMFADSKMTVRVSIDTATFTKVISLPNNAEIKRNELSQIMVDMSGEEVECQTSVTFDFSKEALYNVLQSNASTSIVGSDGKSYTLSFSRTKCSLKGEDGFPCAIQLSSPSGTAKYLYVPAVSGKDVSAVRLFAQVKHGKSDSQEDSLAALKNGNVVCIINGNMSRTQNSLDYLANRGGVAELTLPELGLSSLSGCQIQSTALTVDYSAMTLILRDKVIPVYDHNDYLSTFEAGIDINIGGTVYNIENYPHYISLKMSEINDLTPVTNSFASNGLVFIDNDAPEKVMTSTGNIAFGTDAVIIGRYISGKGQPRIAINGSSKYMQVQNSLHVLNCQLEHNSSYCFFTSKAGYSDVYVQDCMLLSTDNYGHGFARLNGAGVGFKNIVVDNCVFVYGGGSGNSIYFLNNASGGNTADNFAQLTGLTIRNTVFIPRPGTASAVKTSILNAPQNTSNASFTIEGNSFYGMTAVTPKAILNLKTAKNIVFKNNVLYCETELTDNLEQNLVSVSGTFTSSTVTGNWMNKYENGGYSFIWNPAADNYNASKSAFFKTDRISEYYLPVDTSVVTTGAGASYDTKLWKSWK